MHTECTSIVSALITIKHCKQSALTVTFCLSLTVFLYSDATLNPSGIRFGSADIYRIGESGIFVDKNY